MDELFTYVREDAIALESRCRKASISGSGTAQEVADFREYALQAERAVDLDGIGLSA